MSAPLAPVVAAHPELSVILASPAGHTEVAARLTELSHPTSESSVRRWRAKPVSSSQLVPVVQAEIVEAEVVEPLALPLPEKVTSALAPVTPSKIDIEAADGLATTRVTALTDLATALDVKKALGSEDCTVTITATSTGTRLVVVYVKDDKIEQIVVWAARGRAVSPLWVAETYASYLGEDFYWKVRKVGGVYGPETARVPVLGKRTKRLLDVLQEKLLGLGWHATDWDSFGDVAVFQNLINPEAVEQAETFYYKGPALIDYTRVDGDRDLGGRIVYVPTTGTAWQEAPAPPRRGFNDGPSRSAKWAKIPGGRSTPPPGLEPGTSWGQLGWWTDQIDRLLGGNQ